MDPDETLRNARQADEDYRETDDAETANDASERLAEAFRALDDWLSKGGFPPADWTSNGVQAS